MKRIIFFLLIITGITVFSAAQAGNDLLVQEGIASWYGEEFDGRPTASGEIFNSALYTAAHPTLPFDTILVVTNSQNNRQVIVRVNDRGPFVPGRIIDLSRAAAEVLDMLSTGTAPVLIERAQITTMGTTLGPAPGSRRGSGARARAAEEAAAAVPVPEEVPQVEPVPVAAALPAPVPQQEPPAPMANLPASAIPVEALAETVRAAPQQQVFYPAPPATLIGSVPPAGSNGNYRIQVGAYLIPKNASDTFDRLSRAGLKPAFEQFGDYYRVVLPGLKASEIQPVAQTLGNTGFREAIIRLETH